MEDEIKKELETITNLRIFPNTTKVVIYDFGLDASDYFGLKMSKEQFKEFQEWLVSKGFVGAEIEVNELRSFVLKEILTRLGYVVMRDDRRRGMIYRHNDGKKAVIINYTMDDVVKIKGITYLEQKNI